MSYLPISYVGNKKNEFKYFENYLNFTGIKNIIEPFCGSCSISFKIYKKHGNKFNYYLNDNDSKHIKLLNFLKSTNTDEIEKGINDIIQTINGKDDFVGLYNKCKENMNMYEYIYFSKYSFMKRLGMYYTRGNRGKNGTTMFKLSKLNLEFIEFLKQDSVYILCGDWYDIFNKHKNKESFFIFDPPYIDSCNEYYRQVSNGAINVYEYFYENDYSNSNTKICFILENIWIIKLLFRNYKTIEYNKCYSISKKNTKHSFIYNY